MELVVGQLSARLLTVTLAYCAQQHKVRLFAPGHLVT